jgi:hypothetical protein
MEQRFPGFDRPTSDFQATRDDRRARLFYYDVDLSNGRTLDTALDLDWLAGNFFYIDQDPAFSGFASVVFNDDGYKGAPIYVGPGTLSRVPFVGVKIYNLAQPGKVLRIVYGTDVDFDPQSGAIQNVNVVTGSTVQITGANQQPIDGEYPLNVTWDNSNPPPTLRVVTPEFSKNIADFNFYTTIYSVNLGANANYFSGVSFFQNRFITGIELYRQGAASVSPAILALGLLNTGIAVQTAPEGAIGANGNIIDGNAFKAEIGGTVFSRQFYSFSDSESKIQILFNKPIYLGAGEAIGIVKRSPTPPAFATPYLINVFSTQA